MLLQKLVGLSSVIKEICEISGSAGLSYGVLHHGQIIHTQHFGYRDVEQELEPNNDTLYFIASLSKAFTAAAIGILVDEGKISWDTPVVDVIPEFHQRSEPINKATVTDLLAHRTGMAGKNAFWIQSNQRLLLPKDQQISTCNYLEPVVPFRSKWKYSNWGYGLAGEVIERITGDTYGSFVKKRIFEPLGMDRTTADSPSEDNLAEAYMVHEDGRPAKISRPGIGGSTVIGAAGGIKSSIADLLLFYQDILQQSSQNSSETASILKQVDQMFAPHAIIGDGPLEKMAYGLGLVRTQLPCTLGLIGMNDMYLGSSMPVVGKSSKKLILHHNGNLSGFLTSINMIPDSQTAIIVLGNSMPFTDPPDLVGQLILETILEEPNPNDYVQVAKDSRDAHIASYTTLAEELESGKGEPSTRPLSQYVGRYHNSIKNFVLDVSIQSGGLRLVVQEFDAVSYNLEPYNGQIFCWGPPSLESEEAGQAMFPRTYAGFHKIKFIGDGDGEGEDEIEALIWAHDPDIAEGEVFQKETKKATTKPSLIQKVLKPL